MRFLLPAVLSCACVACVSAGTHEELKQRYDKAQGQLSEQGVEIESLSQELRGAQEQLNQLHADLAASKEREVQLGEEKEALTAEAERLRAELSEVQEQLASMVHDRAKLTSTTKQLTDALRQLSERKAQADARVAEFRSLLARFKELIDAGKLEVRIVDGRMVMALPTDVLFASGSAELSKDGAAAVTQVATVLASMRDRRFQVEGHTDNVPIHTARYPSNWELSVDRALGVVKAMLQAKMSPKRISAAGFGENHPVASNETEQGRKKNRRIEVVLQPDLSMLPGYDELEAIVIQR